MVSAGVRGTDGEAAAGSGWGGIERVHKELVQAAVLRTSRIDGVRSLAADREGMGVLGVSGLRHPWPSFLSSMRDVSQSVAVHRAAGANGKRRGGRRRNANRPLASPLQSYLVFKCCNYFLCSLPFPWLDSWSLT